MEADNMARIACVYSVEIYGTAERPLTSWRNVPYGLSLIAACLEKAGHEVRCWVVCSTTDLHAMALEMIREFRCDCVAATSVTTQFPTVVNVLSEIKRVEPSVLTIVGGAHPSLNPNNAIELPCIDAICIGEGERAMLTIASAIDRGVRPAHVPGMWFKTPAKLEIDRTPPLPFESEIDSLPPINLKHWEHWVRESDRSFRIVIGRGCPYGCAYCSNHALKKITTGRYLRVRSPKNILNEIEKLVETYPEITELFLETETIGAVPGFAIELCKYLEAFNAKRQKPILFLANLAVTAHLAQNAEETSAMLTAFRRANLLHVNIGLESGSERIRKEILNRPTYTNADLIKFCLVAKEHGIKVSLFVLMGLPTETVKDYYSTVEVARACQPNAISESIFYPYPGTKLSDLSIEMHLFNPDTIDTRSERTAAHLKLKGFPKWRIRFEYVFITWRVFRGRLSWLSLTKRMAYKALSVTPNMLSVAHSMWAAVAGPSQAR